jgi:hypothetical protein
MLSIIRAPVLWALCCTPFAARAEDTPLASQPVPLAPERFESIARGRGLELYGCFERTLAWIEGAQQQDGSWSAPVGVQGDAQGDVRATALAALALMADGCSTRVGPHSEAIVRAIRWFRDRQDTETGAFLSGGQPVGVEDHAFATLAVGQAYRFSYSPLLRVTAQRAASRLIELQREDGGWSVAADAPGPELDATAWAARALCVADTAGVKVGEDVLRGALLSLGPSLDPAVGPPASGEDERVVRIAIASYVRLHAARTLGFDGQRAVFELQALELEGRVPSGRRERGIDAAFCVLGTNASRLARTWHPDLLRPGGLTGPGGGHQRLWEFAIAAVPGELQGEDGSFDPADVGDPRGGRLEATALVVLWTAAVLGE